MMVSYNLGMDDFLEQHVLFIAHCWMTAYDQTAIKPFDVVLVSVAYH